MHSPIFENTHFLKSVGWAIAHSFWQAGLLWMIYRLVTAADKKMPALVKHHLCLVLSVTSLIWFLFTISKNYDSFADYQALEELHPITAWLLPLQQPGTILPVISIIYFLFLGIHTLKFLNKLVGNRALQHHGLSKAPFDLRLYISHTAVHLGIKRKVQVWMSEKVDVPAVTGFIKPIILLPAAIVNHLSTRQVESILLHELAHIKRNDYLVNLCQSAIELILFFNPFVHLLSKDIGEERENCCDDWVLTYRYNRYDYASALLILEEQRQLKPGFALTATNNKKNLLLRVKRLFKSPYDTSFTIRHQAKIACLCLLLLLGILVTLPIINAENFEVAAIQTIKNGRINIVNRNDKGRTAKPGENTRQNIVATNLLKMPKIRPAPKVVIGKTAGKKENGEYMSALINEELLPGNITAEPITISSINDMAEDKKYFIKIEEQQSGNTQVNTFYFELNNKSGTPNVKPLIFLKLQKVPANTNISVPNKPDSTTTPAKKRVTS